MTLDIDTAANRLNSFINAIALYSPFFLLLLIKLFVNSIATFLKSYYLSANLVWMIYRQPLIKLLLIGL